MSDTTSPIEKRYRLLVEGATEYAILLFDNEGRLIEWNTGAQNIFGWRPDEVLGQVADLIFTPEDRATNIPSREFAITRRDGHSMDLRWHVKRDGTRFFADGVMELLRDDAGHAIGFSKILRDATERHVADEALAERTRLSALAGDVGRALTTLRDLPKMLDGCAKAMVEHLDAAFARIWVLSDTENVLVLHASAGLYTHLNGPHGRVPVGKYKIGHIAQERIPHLTNDVFTDPQVSDPEWARREGMVSFAGYPLLVDDRLVGVVALFARHTLSDVTLQALGSVADQIAVGIDRCRAEDELREANKRTANVLESITESFFSVDSEWRYTYVNAPLERLVHRSREELLGRDMWESFPDVLGTGFETNYRHAMAHQVPVVFEEYFEPLDFWIEVRVYPSANGLSAFIQDITERRRNQEIVRASEERLRDAQQRLEAALSAGGIGTWTWDPVKDIVVADENLAQLFGVTTADASGGHIAAYTERMHPDDRERVSSTIDEALLRGSSYEAEYRVLSPQGLYRWLQTRGKVLRDAEGQAIALPGVAVDVTAQVERRQREQFLADLAERSRSLTEPEDVQDDAVRSLGLFLGLMRCSFADIDSETGICTVPVEYRSSDAIVSQIGAFPLAAFGDFLVSEFASGHAVVSNDTHSDANLPPQFVIAYDDLGIRAHITIPVVHSTRIVSIISCHSDKPRQWTTYEIALVRAVVERTWLTVEVARQQHALTQQAERTTRVLETITDGFYQVGRDWRIRYINSQAQRMLHREHDELIGKPLWDMFPEAVEGTFYRELYRAMEGNSPAFIEEYYPPLDAWLDVRVFPSVDGLSVFFENSTERHNAADALRNSEANLRNTQQRLAVALSGGGIATWMFDLLTDHIVADDEMARLFGVDPTSLGGVPHDAYTRGLHPDDRARASSAMNEAINGDGVYEIEYRAVQPDGSVRWLSVKGQVQRDDSGRAIAVAGVSVDITEQVERRERARFLSDLAERARRLTEPEDIIADAVNSVGAFLHLSRCTFADIDSEEDTCTIPYDYCAEGIGTTAGTFPISAFGEFLVNEFKAGRTVVVEDVRSDSVRINPQSVPAYVDTNIIAFVAAPVVHSARTVSCIACHSSVPRRWTALEIELVEAVIERTWLTVEVARKQRELSQETATKARLLDTFTDGFYAIDRNWNFTFVNSQAERMLLRNREEIVGRNIWEAFPEAVGSTFYTVYTRAMEDGGVVTVEDYYAPLDSWLDVRVYPSADGLSVFFQNVSERKRADRERQKVAAEQLARAEREALLNRIGYAIRSASDPATILEIVVREVGVALDADRCYYAAYDRSSDHATVGPDWQRAGLVSMAGSYTMSRFKINSDPDYMAGRTQMISDASEDSGATAIGLTSLLRVPLVLGNSMTTLTAAMVNGPREWTADEIALVEAVAAQTRSAVETALLLLDQQAHLEEEALVGRIGAAIRSELEPAIIEEAAAELLGEVLVADRCFFITYDHFRDLAIVGRDYHRRDLPPLSGEYQLSDFAQMLSEVFRDGTTAKLTDVRNSLTESVAKQMELFQHRSVLAVPFFDSGRLVACLWASADVPRAWTAHEAALMEQAATLTRTALESAHISRRERAIAQQLQAALQPAVPDKVIGLSVGSFTRAALDEAQIGGDFFDVFELDKNLYAIVIGDVSGKGLAAAQQLALIRNSLRTTLYLYQNPAQAASILNSIVTAHELLVGFVTAFVAVYDASTGVVSYASCGHEPGLLRRADGTVEMLSTTGPPLGVDVSANFDSASVTLENGDEVLIYTDGISEAGPSRRELLGTDGLISLFTALSAGEPVQAQAESLVSQVAAHAQGVFRDDVAVLLMRRQ